VQRKLERSTGVYAASFDRSGPYIRPTESYDATVNYFLPGTLGGDHAWKAGFRYRTAKEHSELHVVQHAGPVQQPGRPAAHGGLRLDALPRFDRRLRTEDGGGLHSGHLHPQQADIEVRPAVGRQWNKALKSEVPAHPFAPQWLPR